MSRTQLRDTQGRYAGGLAHAVDTMLRSGAHLHGRTVLDSTDPLSVMAGSEAGDVGDKYLYAVAARASVRWIDGDRPTRHVEVEYVDPSRERIVVREVPGRVGCTDGRVHVAAVAWGEVPARIAVPEAETERLDVPERTYAAFGDALAAHEEIHR